MQNKKKVITKGLIGATTIAVLSLGSYLGLKHYHQYQNRWTSIGTMVNNTNTMFKTSNKAAKQGKITYEIYEKPGCKDCQKLVDNKIVKDLYKLKKDNTVIVYNTKNVNTNQDNNPTATQSWMIQNFIYSTPGIVVKYKGYPIYNYAGTNLKTWRTISNGINPVTKKRFAKKIPKAQQVINDFNKTKTTYASIKINNIDNGQQ